MILSTNDEKGVSMVVVEKVAEQEGVDPLEIQPIFEVVNPEALDQIVETTSSEVSINFPYQGYMVTVSGTGEVEITEKT